MAYRASFAGGGTAGTGDRTVTITPAVGDTVTVYGAFSGNTNTAPTMTDDNGGTYYLISAVLYNTSANMACAFIRTALMPNTTSTVITAVTGSNTSGELVAICDTGITRLGSAAVRGSGAQSNQSAAATPAPVLSGAALTGNPTHTVCANITNPPAVTVPASWTERKANGQATPAVGLTVDTRDTGFTGTTITWGGVSDSAFASLAVELDTSAAAGGALAPKPLVINQTIKRASYF